MSSNENSNQTNLNSDQSNNNQNQSNNNPNQSNLNSNQSNNPDQSNENSNQTPIQITPTTTTQFINTTLNQTIVEAGLIITNQQGQNTNNNETTHSTFNTTDPTLYDPQITENLISTVEIDDTINSATANIIAEIQTYATQIKCESFHGKGTIDDYAELFKAASYIANESKQMTLDVDIDGFNEFGQAADELSALFTNYIIKLQNISIINDLTFLTSIAESLKKIVNLSNTFGKFKETILATSTIKIPKSIGDTKIVISNVMDELNCAMKYINNFVDPTLNPTVPIGADLSDAEKNIIKKAVSTIDNWNLLADHGVSIAMSADTDIQYINNANIEIKNKTSILKSTTNKLKSKLALYNNIR